MIARIKDEYKIRPYVRQICRHYDPLDFGLFSILSHPRADTSFDRTIEAGAPSVRGIAYDTPWREPKLLITYVFGNNGRRDQKGVQIIDGTFMVSDALAELLACHLYRLGASRAEQVLFIADGTQCIWDRITMGAHKAENWHACVDFCHVMNYVSAAVNSFECWDKAYLKKRQTELPKTDS